MSLGTVAQAGLFGELAMEACLEASAPGTAVVVRRPQQGRHQTTTAESSAAGTVGLSVCVLGSGSGGNCTVVRIGDRAVLIDCGFGPATTARRLRAAEFDLANVKAVCLTHLDQDHFRPHWIRTLAGWSIAVYLHRWYLDDFLKLDGAAAMAERGLVRAFDDGGFEPLDGVRATPIHLAHDTHHDDGAHP